MHTRQVFNTALFNSIFPDEIRVVRVG